MNLDELKRAAAEVTAKFACDEGVLPDRICFGPTAMALWIRSHGRTATIYRMQVVPMETEGIQAHRLPELGGR